jgi:hypothetical protein
MIEDIVISTDSAKAELEIIRLKMNSEAAVSRKIEHRN